MEEEILKPKDVANRLKVSVATVQRWSNEGKLKDYRTITGRRYYLPEEVEEFEKKYFGME